MLFLTLFVVAVITICVLGAWSWPNIAEEAARMQHGSAAPKPGAAAPARPESLEGVLVAQLVAGEITQHQYRHAVEGLAVRDEERHPLAVPPEIGPADA
jgi:hypothetical protein